MSIQMVMCSSMSCTERKKCQRNSASGTKPASKHQSYVNFGFSFSPESKDGIGCHNFIKADPKQKWQKWQKVKTAILDVLKKG